MLVELGDGGGGLEQPLRNLLARAVLLASRSFMAPIPLSPSAMMQARGAMLGRNKSHRDRSRSPARDEHRVEGDGALSGRDMGRRDEYRNHDRDRDRGADRDRR